MCGRPALEEPPRPSAKSAPACGRQILILFWSQIYEVAAQRDSCQPEPFSKHQEQQQEPI